MSTDTRPWYRQLTGYHWFVFIVASAAWFFDCLDQRLFSLARIPAMEALMPTSDTAGLPRDVQALGKDVTAFFLIGWGIGGLVFGALGDRYGRAKMLTLTVLIYSVFTGLTFFSRTYWDFAAVPVSDGLGRRRRVRVGGGADCRNAAQRRARRCAGHAADSVDGRQYLGRRLQVDRRSPASKAKSSRRARLAVDVSGGCRPGVAGGVHDASISASRSLAAAKRKRLLPKGSILAPYIGLAQRSAVAEEPDHRRLIWLGRRDRPVGDRRIRDRFADERVSTAFRDTGNDRCPKQN